MTEAKNQNLFRSFASIVIIKDVFVLFQRSAFDVFVNIHCLVRIGILGLYLFIYFYCIFIFALLFENLAGLNQINRTECHAVCLLGCILKR